jgi:hypothetical protein
MIQKLLGDFIQTLDCKSKNRNQNLSLETFYAGLSGKFEDYIRWKFVHYIYQNQFNKKNISQQSISIESFDRTDMVFFDSSSGSKDVHFVEWKSMTLPVSGQTNRVYEENWTSNNDQLQKAMVKFKELNLNNYIDSYWSLFVFVDFNEQLINLLNQNNQSQQDLQLGILSKYNISCKMRSDHLSICTNNLSIPYTPITLKRPPWCKNGEEIILIFGFIQIQPQNSNTYKLTSI